jgi:hypothetical protein
MIPSDRILNLASDLHAEMLLRDGSLAHLERTESAFSVWRIANHHASVDRQSFVFQEISRALPTSLMLAIDIGYYWTSENAISGLTRMRVYRYTKALAARTFRDIESLVAALPPLGDGSNPYTLHQLLRAGQLHLGLDTASTVNGTRWLVDLLLSTTKLPTKLLIQVVCLLSKEVELDSRKRIVTLDIDFVTSFVPHEVERLAILKAVFANWENLAPAERATVGKYQPLLDDIGLMGPV